MTDEQKEKIKEEMEKTDAELKESNHSELDDVQKERA